MKRREFVTLLGGAAAWPLAARAQQGDRVRRVGVLLNAAETEVEYQGYLAAFVQEMRRLGWSEGQNLQLDVRWNAGDAVLSRTYAGQLIGLMPDAIVTGSTVNLAAVQQRTKAIPIVFVSVADPLTQGFVPNMRQPGGNVTGRRVIGREINARLGELTPAPGSRVPGCPAAGLWVSRSPCRSIARPLRPAAPEIPVTNGMAVTVEIKTGQRRIIDYVFSPLVEVASTAMKER
jgi:hypothetical protein